MSWGRDGTPFFTMKLAAGGCLTQRIGDFKGKWREIAELIATIAEAVHYAHERGVLHRDLEPGNVLFDESGQALVSDFGLAKIIDEEADLTRTIALMGTPNYMAPELTRGGKGAATTACDVWSLGVMLYELLAGQQPFRGDNLATILRQLNEAEPDLLPREVPHDLSVIAGKALQKNPARRFTSAQELAEDLRRWLRGDAILARGVSPWQSSAGAGCGGIPSGQHYCCWCWAGWRYWFGALESSVAETRSSRGSPTRWRSRRRVGAVRICTPGVMRSWRCCKGRPR